MTFTPITEDNKHCPCCGLLSLEFLERCDTGDESEEKTSWTCHMPQCEGVGIVVYIYRFDRSKE